MDLNFLELENRNVLLHLFKFENVLTRPTKKVA